MFKRSDFQTEGNISVACDRRQSRRGSLCGSSRNRQRRAASRCHHGLEWLEPRWLLATNLGGIVAVEPAGGAPLSQSPQDLVITLDQPYVPFLMGNFDVQLEELNRDGTTTPVWNSINAPIEQTDATGTELIIPVQTYDPASFLSQNLTLSPGKYEIELTGGTGISEYASGAFGPGPQLWDPSQPYAIGGFTLLGAGAKFTSATNLGTINSFGPPVLGFLNPDDYHSAVDLYKFTLRRDTSGRSGSRSPRPASAATCYLP